jgi:ferrochelatase
VAHHYARFGGVSPITALTRRQADGLQVRLDSDGPALPVYVGMRNWHPFLRDTLRQMAADGVRRAIGFILAAHRSYSGCTQYKENVRDARAELAAGGIRTPDVVFTGDWHAHAGYVETCAQHIADAIHQLPEGARSSARVVFTAHSIPLSMAERYPYREQLLEGARLIAARLNRTDWALVYQSRSGRPEDPWLEPDVCDYLRAEHANGLRAAILAPIGFVSDHIEVLYDLDVEAAEVCSQLGLPMVRAAAANDDPLFLDMIADVVRSTYEHYRDARPLAIAMP